MDEIYEIKEKILHYLSQQVGQGMERADLNELDVLVDMVKDLSEAEYKCAVTEAMAGDYGYTPQGMGYDDGMGYGRQAQGRGGMGRSGYRDSRGRYTSRPRMGYGGGRMGYDSQALRDMWADATPEEREQMKRDMGL